MMLKNVKNQNIMGKSREQNLTYLKSKQKGIITLRRKMYER